MWTVVQQAKQNKIGARKNNLVKINDYMMVNKFYLKIKNTWNTYDFCLKHVC